MSNDVYSKIICTEKDLKKYFLDYDPFGDGKRKDNPYITFNHLFGVKALNEYEDLTKGEKIDYGWGFIYRKRADGFYEILFTTRWKYPIEAIKQAITLSHEITWYVFEENRIYVSRFSWKDGVREDYLILEDVYDDWLDENETLYSAVEVPDDDVWIFLNETKQLWHHWESDDGFKRYIGISAYNVQPPLYLQRHKKQI